MERIKQILLSLFLFLSLFSEAAELNKTDNVIFTAMEKELGRAMKMLKIEKDRPYYISYFIDEVRSYRIGATLGCLFDEKDSFYRNGAAIVKVGSYKYDNSIYKRKRKNYDWELSSRATTDIPIGNNIKAIRHKLWLLTDSVFKKAINEYTVKKETEELEVKKKDKLLDFTKGKKVKYYEDYKEIKLDREKWESIIKKLSLEFKKCPFL
ncbi:MAG: hypothetical protein KAW47_11370, partial [Thermoplasmatales archaeon]|nr:hypothetical protein [Thermoplasmatales archaeon]